MKGHSEKTSGRPSLSAEQGWTGGLARAPPEDLEEGKTLPSQDTGQSPEDSPPSAPTARTTLNQSSFAGDVAAAHAGHSERARGRPDRRPTARAAQRPSRHPTATCLGTRKCPSHQHAALQDSTGTRLTLQAGGRGAAARTGSPSPGAPGHVLTAPVATSTPHVSRSPFSYLELLALNFTSTCRSLSLCVPFFLNH